MQQSQRIRLLRLSIILWWILFAGITTSLNLASFVSRGNAFSDFSFRSNFVWQTGWLIWGALTFLAIYLARRYPINRERLLPSLLKHLGLGLSIVCLHIVLEASLNAPLRSLFGLEAQSAKQHLISLIAYKSHIHFIIYLAIVGVTNAADNYLKLSAIQLKATQLEAKLAQSELQSLKMQLQPHFLFNTHHSIISLMLKNDNEAAIKMLTRLSDLLRLTLQKNRQQTVTLQEELDTLALYLEIQKARFKERLEIEYKIDPNTLAADIPYLILQPIVENAIQHGADPLTGGSHLVISSRLDATQLILEVHDNGPGMNSPSEFLNQNGIGLSTTIARLEQLSDIPQPLAIESKPEQGTCVTIRLPFKTCSSHSPTEP